MCANTRAISQVVTCALFALNHALTVQTHSREGGKGRGRGGEERGREG